MVLASLNPTIYFMSSSIELSPYSHLNSYIDRYSNFFINTSLPSNSFLRFWLHVGAGLFRPLTLYLSDGSKLYLITFMYILVKRAKWRKNLSYSD